MSRPPSKRITISATTPIRSTVTKEIVVADPRHEVGDDRRGDEEERRARDRQPLGDRAAEQRQRDPGRDDEDDHAEVWDLRHRVNLGVCEVAAGAYTFLT